MSGIAIKILEICLIPFTLIDNPIVLVPLSFLVVLGVFGLLSRMMKS